MNNYTLITGSSSGIGYELAIKFAEEGHNLILVSRSETKLQKLKERINEKTSVDVIIFPCDLTNEDSLNRLFKHFDESNENIDILCNNAGVGYYGDFLDSKIENAVSMIALNITALTRLTYYFGHKMKMRNTGTILNIAAVGSFVPGPMFAVYYATKAYVLSFSEALSMELKPYNVNVCTICPGPTNTNFFINASTGQIDLLKRIKPVSPRVVSEFAYNSLKKKKVVGIPCFKNKISVFFTKHLSRKTVRKIMYKIQNNRTK